MAKEKYKFVFDAETFPNFHSYTFKNIDTGEYYKFIIFDDRQNEERSINQLPELLYFVENRCKWLIGYNNASYDNMLLMYLLININRLRTSTARVITSEIFKLSSIITQHQREKRTPPEVFVLRKKEMPFQSLDLILLYNTTERTSLKQIAIGLKWPVLEDLPFATDHIIMHDEIGKIQRYNRNDVDITEKLMHHLSEKINHRIAITKRLGVNIVNSSNSDIAKKLIAHYYTKETGIPYKDYKDKRTAYEKLPLKYCISPSVFFETREYQKLLEKVKECTINPNIREDPNKKGKKQFEVVVRSKYVSHTMGLGGIHSNGPSEILEETNRYAYIDIDARSFYPYIIVNDRLYPRHLGPAFVDVYKKYIVDERMKIVDTDPILAYMLKIAANATFGLTKSFFSWLYDPHITTYICVSGYLMLCMLMEALEKYSHCIVVYSNTDGLTVRVPREEMNLFKMICEKWMQKVNFKLEYVRYTRMILRDVNNFIMFSYSKDPEKSIKAKGAYVYKKDEFKGYHYPIVAKSIQDYFQKDIPIEDTVFKSRDIYDFMASEKTSLDKFEVCLYPRVDRDNPIKLQKTNRWIVTQGNIEEGKLYKISRADLKKTEMEKDFYVTILNNVEEMNIEDYHLDYNFYISEAYTMINLTQVLRKETHVKSDIVQGKLFLV